MKAEGIILIDLMCKIAHAVLDVALAATLVWLMLNYKDILTIVMT